MGAGGSHYVTFVKACNYFATMPQTLFIHGRSGHVRGRSITVKSDWLCSHAWVVLALRSVRYLVEIRKVGLAAAWVYIQSFVGMPGRASLPTTSHIDLASQILALVIESRGARCDEHVRLAPLITTARTCTFLRLRYAGTVGVSPSNKAHRLSPTPLGHSQKVLESDTATTAQLLSLIHI